MKKLAVILCFFSFISCREKYDYIPGTPDQGLLVVEGIVNTTGNSTIRLSRTTNLEEESFVPEKSALVMVEGEDNSSFTFTPLGNGIYTSSVLPLADGSRYRLHIITKDNREYVSDYRAGITTQAIDSISYTVTDGEVEFFVNSHDADPKKYYFKYEVEETWEFLSDFRATLKFDVTRGPGDQINVELKYYDTINFSLFDSIYRCWKSRVSNDILIGSTEMLSESRIFLPVKKLRRDAWELGHIYSIYVKQYALSPEGYDFFRRLKKNSQSLGSVFDAQPSELAGNLTCINDPEEQVIGFVEFSTSEEKRLFVHSDQLPGEPYDTGCRPFGSGGILQFPYPFDNNPGVREFVFDELGLVPTLPARTMGRGVITFYAEDPLCVDCTLRGSNIKPSFWP